MVEPKVGFPFCPSVNEYYQWSQILYSSSLDPSEKVSLEVSTRDLGDTHQLQTRGCRTCRDNHRLRFVHFIFLFLFFVFLLNALLTTLLSRAYDVWNFLEQPRGGLGNLSVQFEFSALIAPVVDRTRSPRRYDPHLPFQGWPNIAPR